MKVETDYLNNLQSDYSSRAAVCAIASVALAIAAAVSFVKAFRAKDEANYSYREIERLERS